MKKNYLFLLLILSMSIYSQNYELSQGILNSQITGDDQFGWNISTSGNYLISTAKRSNVAGAYNGAAYIYEKNSSGQYNIVANIYPTNSVNNTFLEFGESSAIYGDYAVFTQLYGLISIYKRNSSGSWPLHQQFVSYGSANPEGPNSLNADIGYAYGKNLAITDNWLVIGNVGDVSVAPYASGATYVYKKNMAGDWVYFQKLVPSTPTEQGYFGRDVSISGNNLMIRDHTGVYAFKTNTAGNWVETQKISIPVNTLSSYTGYPVEINGNTAVIGSPKNIFNNYENGSAYVYNLNSFGVWVQSQVLAPFNNGTTLDATFGMSVAVSDTHLLVGSYHFKKLPNGTWAPNTKLPVMDNVQLVKANSVAIIGDNLLIGQSQYNEGDLYNRLGKVYVFKPDVCDLVAIPDPNFEQALLDQNIDTDGLLNGTICRRDAELATNLALDNKNINNLTGIEAFINIEYLSLNNNNLTSLNLQYNTKLLDVGCRYNNLTNINVANCPDLILLVIEGNNLSNVDVTNNLNLKYFTVGENPLTSINVSNNLDLRWLFVNESFISNIDVTNNTLLEYLYVYDNQLTSLDISNNLFLIELLCENNQIRSLDFSNHIYFYRLNCSNNNLNYLNVNNNNNNPTLAFFNARFNPELFCIQVDDVNYSTNNNWFKDAIASYNTFCPEPPILGPIAPIYCNANIRNFTLQWDPIFGAEGYQVEVIVGTSTTSQFYNLSANQTSITLKKLSSKTNWRLRPLYQNNGIWSEWRLDCLELIGPDDPFISYQPRLASDINTELTIYPNPSKKGTLLHIDSQDSITSLKIFNVSGQTVYQTNEDVREINVNNLESGIYMVNIETSSNTITKKIIIE